VDDDRLVAVAKTVLDPVVCSRFGSKGIGIIIFVDAKDDFFKKKKVIKLADGELGIELLTRGGGTFIPPSVHRKTGATYKWLVGDLATELHNLPIMTREQWDLLNSVISSPEALTLLGGEATHDAMRDLCAKIVRCSEDNDYLVEVVQSVFSADYTGENNADREIARTLKGARERGFDKPSNSGMPPETVRKLEELNKRACVVKVGGKTLVLEKSFDYEFERYGYVFQSVNDFKSFHLDELVEVSARDGRSAVKPIGHVWINWQKRSKALAVVLLPNRDPGLVSVDGGNIYNLWTGLGVQPVPGEWPRIKYHLEEVICGGNEEYYSYLLGWLAACVQHPERQGEVAVVFKGGRGTGKGTVGRMLARLFGQHYFHAVSSGQVAGRFNAHLRDTVVLFADEAFFAGDKKNEGVLKAIITEDIIAIEAKFVDIAQVKNRLHIVMATNEDWAVPAGTDERRFFILQISDVHKQDTVYFKELNDAINGEELPAFLHSLLEVDLSDFEVRSVPQTDALNYQKERSLDSVADWVLKILMDGPGPVVIVQKPTERQAFDFLFQRQVTKLGHRYKFFRRLPCLGRGKGGVLTYSDLPLTPTTPPCASFGRDGKIRDKPAGLLANQKVSQFRISKFAYLLRFFCCDLADESVSDVDGHGTLLVGGAGSGSVPLKN
jgi:hypothetical protein